MSSPSRAWPYSWPQDHHQLQGIHHQADRLYLLNHHQSSLSKAPTPQSPSKDQHHPCRGLSMYSPSEDHHQASPQLHHSHLQETISMLPSPYASTRLSISTWAPP
ncbi:unnamed protein product [Adineta steineri]|uniref:Uncharacterized protein n=1 Tax=Adineta steineri TaxID=433720 RepID=A0A820HYR9_9BILA|nr:unnamed protein product [Adineta steineri]